MTDLGYFAADTLQMMLYQIEGQLTAHEVHPLTVGPWRVELPINVDSDLLRARELSFWVMLGKTQPLYLVVREQESWLLVLKPSAVQTCEQQTGFVGQTVKERVKELKPAILAVYKWTKEREWARVGYDGSTPPQEHV